MHISRIDLRTWAGVLGLTAVLSAALFAVLASSSMTPQASARDKNCSDFGSQKAAQRWFHKHHPHRDPAGLDADNDGRACEDNPCPCTHHRWKAAPALQAGRRVVLGSRRFTGSYGKGFGTVAPRTIYNGGDLSGLVRKIHWHHWGRGRSLATGRNHIFKPHGGYYRQSVRIRLKASNKGRCPGNHRPAYRKLHVRVPKKPGGKLGPWRNWSGARTICKSPY